MMGCFSTSQTDGTEESFRMSLRSLLATKETSIPAPCIAKQIIERKFGFGTRKTLQARTNLLDTACHSLAKAKQRSLVSLPPSYYMKSDILLFPLPLPPGYKPNTTDNNGKRSTKAISIPSRKLLTAAKCSREGANYSSSARGRDGGVDSTESNSTCMISKKTDDFSGDFSLMSSNCSCTSPGHSSVSNSTSTLCHLYSCEAFTPTSPTSSVFSAATSHSLSQSSSFNSSSTTFSDLRCNSLSYANVNTNYETEDGGSCPTSRAGGSPLKEFSSSEIARAFESASHPHKIAEGTMGPFYKVFLPEEKCSAAVIRVITKLSRKKWRAQLQALARLAHTNLSKVIGFSYERAKYVGGMEGMSNDNIGFIVYEDIGDDNLEDFLQDMEKGIDWVTRLKLAIGIVEGLSFLLENMPSHVDYGYLSLSSIRVDSSLNAKLFDVVVSSTNTSNLKEKRPSLGNVVPSLGNVLLQLFGFASYSTTRQQAQGLGAPLHVTRAYPPNDAKVVVDLAASCLLPEASLHPSVLQVARVLHSIEPTHYGAQDSITCSKSFTRRTRRSLSFG
ncbi:hypothetical protein L7F22_063030 [Adiantum nelumboides]|nr:hypothetical protein [Adiantum nelumboides]